MKRADVDRISRDGRGQLFILSLQGASGASRIYPLSLKKRAARTLKSVEFLVSFVGYTEFKVLL